MTPLLTALYQYAQNGRIDAMISSCDAQELEENSRMAANAMEQLQAMGDIAADLAQRMEYGLQVADAINQEASFLAGLSIGLELSRL